MCNHKPEKKPEKVSEQRVAEYLGYSCPYEFHTRDDIKDFFSLDALHDMFGIDGNYDDRIAVRDHVYRLWCDHFSMPYYPFKEEKCVNSI